MGKLIDCDIIPLGSDSEATVKSRFYLDKLIRVNDGFVGACVDGGGQQNMHNPARFGSVRFIQNGVIYRAFTDGGVNTLGEAISIDVESREAADFIVNTNSKTAFNLPGDIKVTLLIIDLNNNIVNTYTPTNDNEPANQILLKTSKQIIPDIYVGYQCRVLLESINTEGVSSLVSTYLSSDPILLKKFTGAWISNIYDTTNASQVLLWEDQWQDNPTKKVIYGPRLDLLRNDRVNENRNWPMGVDYPDGTYFFESGRFASVKTGVVSLSGWASTSQTISATVTIQRMGLRTARVTVTLDTPNPRPYSLEVTVNYGYTYIPSGSLDPVDGSDFITISIGAGLTSNFGENTYSYNINNLSTTSPINAPIRGLVDSF